MGENTQHEQPKILIAIDGPAGAGKSTVASRLAESLALREGLQTPFDEAAAARVPALMEEHGIDVRVDADGTKILVDGGDVSGEIRTAECSLMASAVSAIPAVRQALLPLQRDLAARNGGVMEGRDIGTVVLPDAHLKIYLTASADERAARRHKDLAAGNDALTIEEVREQQQQRDLQDTSRDESPLQVARGSVVVDTTGLGLDEVVQRLLSEVENQLSNEP